MLMPDTHRPVPLGSIDHVDALPAGTRLAEFEILSVLGVGGFGMVYQAFDHSLQRQVAIKEYFPTALAGRAEGHSLWVRSSSDEQSFQAGLHSFVGEARLLAQFDHPSLVKVFRFWEDHHTAYMVMPLYTGMTLKQARMHMRTPPSEEWLRKVLWSITSALRVLHDDNTLHRDISPDNIFLQDSGPPVLLDLGAARFAIEDNDTKHTAVLKVNYAPIEQYSEADAELRIGPWSDLYSLAAVVYGCVCNDTPLPATLRSIRDRMVSFKRVARTVSQQFGVQYSPGFVMAVSKALEIKPQNRPRSIDAFLQFMDMSSPPAKWDKFDFRAELGDVWVEPVNKRVGSAITVDLSDDMEDLVSVPLSEVAGVPSPTPASALVAAPTSASIPASIFAPAPAPTPALAPAPAAVASKARVRDFQETIVQPDESEFLLTQLVEHEAALFPAAKAQSAHAGKPSKPAKAAARPDMRPGSRGSAGSSSRMVIGLSALILTIVVLAGLWFWSSAASRPAPAAPLAASAPYVTPDNEIITESAEAPALTASAVEAATAAASAASVPAAFAVSADQKPRVSAARKPVEPVAAAASSMVASPATPEPLDAQPAKTAVVEPARAVSPLDQCANAGFLAKPLCIHTQCQKAGMASHPVCVDNKKRLDEEERRKQLYSQ